MLIRKRTVSRLMLASAITVLAALSPSIASAEGITLKVFGGSALNKLAPRQTPEVQKSIQDKVIAGFLAAHPEVKAVEWDAQGPQANDVQRLMTARLANQEMDLIACSAFYTNGAYVRRGLVRPITKEIEALSANLDQPAIGAFTVRGEVYAVPITTMSTSAIFYNKKAFADLGIPVPPTYEDLKAAAPKLAAAGMIPLLHQGSNTPMWPMWYFETFSQASGDPIGRTTAILDGKAKFNDADGVAAFQLIKQWVDDGILSKDSLAVDQDGMRSAFASGKSAMYYGGTWEVPSLQESVHGFEWGTFAFPKMAGTPGEPKHGGGADNGMCMSATIAPEKVAPAVAFMSYLTQPEVATLYLEPEQPLATSVKGVPVVEDTYAKDLRASAFPNTVKFLDWVWPAEVATAVSSSIAGVVGGQITPQQAADSVQAVYDDLVAQGNWPPQD
ncbi:MAG: extracellular solute-binding protein [Candidatus Kaistia colombiensis]|nr:MAG: extracellular solute-binding protein [Kaistia sp.]